MSEKRKLGEQDNDSQDSDQLNVESVNIQNGSMEKSSVEKKLRKIIEQHFDEEIQYKKYELEKINEV